MLNKYLDQIVFQITEAFEKDHFSWKSFNVLFLIIIPILWFFEIVDLLSSLFVEIKLSTIIWIIIYSVLIYLYIKKETEQ